MGTRGIKGSGHAGQQVLATILLILFGTTLTDATNVDSEAPSQTTQWIDQLVTPLQNVSLSQIIGRWYAVEQVRNFSLQPEDICETFDFFLSGDNETVYVNHTLARGTDSFSLPAVSVLSDGLWTLNMYQDGYKVLDVSADGGFLSVASCNRYANSCYGVILARDYSLAGRDADLLQVHRGMSRAGLNDTRLGHRQQPDACSPGTLPRQATPLQAAEYDV